MNDGYITIDLVDLELKSTIQRLYTDIKKFPTQKTDIYKKIVEIADCFDYEKCGLKDVVVEAQNNVKFVPHSNQNISIVSANVEELRKNTEEATEQGKRMKHMYFEKVMMIVKQMNREIGKDASDIDKIKWIYSYVFPIPFFTGYGNRRMSDGSFDSRGDTYLEGFDKVPIGVFDKEFLLLTDKNTGVCMAKAGLLKDLCAFANLKESYCYDVPGFHLGEGHTWNAIMNREGIFFIDSSNAWEGEDSYNRQFMIPESRFYNKHEYYDYPRARYEYHPDSIEIVNVTSKTPESEQKSSNGFTVVNVSNIPKEQKPKKSFFSNLKIKFENIPKKEILNKSERKIEIISVTNNGPKK